MQRDEVPMGSSLSPVLPEVFMVSLEEKIFSTAPPEIKPQFFKRHVDDIIAIVPTGKEEPLFDFLNQAFPSHISFTVEKETDGKLPFLDCLVIRSSSGIKTTVYRKTTHSDRYLNYGSHHPPSVFRGIVNGMVNRAINICDKEYLQQELNYIRKVFKSNGYPKRLIEKIINNRIRGQQIDRDKNTTETVLVFAYYAGLCEKILRLGKRLDFRTFFKGALNLRSILRNDKVKTKIETHPGIVYLIKCSCSDKYIGESGNSLIHRFNEHMKCYTKYRKAKARLEGRMNTRRGRPQTLDPSTSMHQALRSSAVAEHTANCSGLLEGQVLCHEQHYLMRKIKEALYT
uniref:Reverse transcriptase domain-containing protein n=1 Tax=Trichuris muris TaxID=70415 RepID=A0A5S6QJZ5_TRIMR